MITKKLIKKVGFSFRNSINANNHFSGRIQAATLFQNIPKDKNFTYLDVGCGTGHISIDLLKAGAKVISIDTSIEKLSILKSQVRYQSFLSNSYPVVAKGEQLPFNKEIFDLAICNSVLEHTDNELELIDEIARVINKQGIFAITVPNKEIRFAHRFQRMWKILLSLNPSFKKILFTKSFHGINNIIQARLFLESHFKHKRLYTIKSISNTVSRRFAIESTNHYMQMIGAISHDLIYSIRGLNWIFPKIFLLFISRLDNVYFRHRRGKGFVVISKKVR